MRYSISERIQDLMAAIAAVALPFNPTNEAKGWRALIGMTFLNYILKALSDAGESIDQRKRSINWLISAIMESRLTESTTTPRIELLHTELRKLAEHTYDDDAVRIAFRGSGRLQAMDYGGRLMAFIREVAKVYCENKGFSDVVITDHKKRRAEHDERQERRLLTEYFIHEWQDPNTVSFAVRSDEVVEQRRQNQLFKGEESAKEKIEIFNRESENLEELKGTNRIVGDEAGEYGVVICVKDGEEVEDTKFAYPVIWDRDHLFVGPLMAERNGSYFYRENRHTDPRFGWEGAQVVGLMLRSEKYEYTDETPEAEEVE